MYREPIFPTDWIAPGEFRFCGCGEILLPKGMMICAKCKYRPKLEDYLCYCGAIATFMNVWGFRCDAHAFQREPNDAMITDRMTITFGRMKTKGDPEKQKAAILDCEVTHQRLTAKKNELAENRRRDGWKPLFWMEAHG